MYFGVQLCTWIGIRSLHICTDCKLAALLLNFACRKELRKLEAYQIEHVAGDFLASYTYSLAVSKCITFVPPETLLNLLQIDLNGIGHVKVRNVSVCFVPFCPFFLVGLVSDWSRVFRKKHMKKRYIFNYI